MDIWKYRYGLQKKGRKAKSLRVRIEFKARILDTISHGKHYGKKKRIKDWFLENISFKVTQEMRWGFPDSSFGKVSACHARDFGSIPGSRWSPGDGIGYPLQYSWASLVVQLVKNPPAMQETWAWSLGWEDPLEKGMAAHSSILAWRIPWTV